MVLRKMSANIPGTLADLRVFSAINALHAFLFYRGEAFHEVFPFSSVSDALQEIRTHNRLF